MTNITEALRKRDEKRSTPFPVNKERQNRQINTPVTAEVYENYVYNDFITDLRRYFDVAHYDSPTDLPFVGFMTCFWDHNSSRKNMYWYNVEHFYMFAATVFYMITCTQVIEKLYGYNMSKCFRRSTRWPEFSAGLGGLMHPIQMIKEADLFPKAGDEQLFLEIFRAAEPVFVGDFLKFLGGSDRNLNPVAYIRLCNKANAEEVKPEIDKLRAHFEQWICNPDTEYPMMYLPVDRR